MALAMEAGLGPSDFVLDGDPATPPPKKNKKIGPYVLWPNGWMDQDGTWR